MPAVLVKAVVFRLARDKLIRFVVLVVMVVVGVRGRLGTVETEHCVVSAEAELDHNKLVSLKRT